AWSLSIEEQFCLVWPLLLVVLVRWGRGWLLYGVGIAAALSLAACAVSVHQHREAAFFLAPFRAWELLLGASLALLPSSPAITARSAQIVAGLGLSMIIGSIVILNESQAFPGLLAVPAFLGAALLTGGGLHNTTVGWRG